jgi:hypothetical protein
MHGPRGPYYGCFALAISQLRAQGLRTVFK